VRRLLDLFARPATRTPKLTLLTLAVITGLLAAAATTLQVSTDLADFAPEGGVAATLDGIEERFDAGASFQVIVDAGPGGDVLTPDALGAAEDLRRTLEDDPEVARWLAADATDRPAVLTFARPFSQASDEVGPPLGELDQRTLDTLIAALFEDDDVGEQVGNLLSDDLELDPPRARAGLAVVELAGGLSTAEVAEASGAVQDALADADAPTLRLSLLSDEVVEEALEEGLLRDIPLLMSLSLLLVVLTLALLFRTASDVVIGLLGLLMSIVWMAGLSGLLGPGMLGLVGPFGQVAIAVPVLLVGLGVDYSVHLTTRYREQQRAGDPPAVAATVALRTVGVALVLATLATVGGFLSNLATPLPPIADLGIFASVGILSAFVILGLGVPAARVLLDRRRGLEAVPEGAGTGSRPSRLADLGTALATRAPQVVIGVTVVLLAVAGTAASGLGTEFEERDFLPDGSAALATIDRTDELFGGDVGEETYVLIDGDAGDPDLLAAAARYEDRLEGIDEVRRLGDRPQVISPFELVHRLGDVGLRARDELADDLDGWDDPDAAAAAVDLPERLDPELLETQFDADDASGPELPDEVVDALRDRLPEGRDPALAFATTSDPDAIRATIREQTREDLIAARPDELSDVQLAELAALPTEELTLDRLGDGGFPLDALDGDRDALATLDALEAAGWDAEDPSRDGAAVAEQLRVVGDIEPDELTAVQGDDGLLLIVSTDAGQDGAPALADALVALGDEVRDAGGSVAAVSQPLVNEEIITSLSDAQLVAILISVTVAGLLLVVASWVSDRSIVLGLIGVAPAAAALILVLGTMRVLGMSFNALTATVASIAVGIGVPYGIHLTNRFRASLVRFATIPEAIADTLRHTGGALAGSAVTTGLAFGVLGLSTSTPLRQFGGVSAMMITYALVACLLLQPSLLVLWARRRAR
jgi:predicted RND superfamily exporter protein